MATKRLTELSLARVTPPKAGRLELADSQLPGLSCRVTTDGTKTFALRYRVGGKQRRLKIGRFPIIGLAEARKRAREALASVEQGIDPAAVKPEAEPDRNTVATVAAEYVERYLRKNTRRWLDAQQMLARDVLPTLGERDIRSLTRRDVLDVVDAIGDRGSPVSANRCLSLIRRFLNWALQRGIVEANVAAGVKPPHKERPRDRVLSDSELRSVWNACDQLRWPIGPFVKLLALTAQRRGELAALSWRDLNLDQGLWVMPREAVKNDRTHEVPLSRLALNILAELPRFEHSDRVFPSQRAESATSISGFSKFKRRLDQASSVTAWSYHDLRRSAASGMARVGVPPHIVSRLLNHAPASAEGITGQVYNRYGFERELRQAVEASALELERIVAGRGPATVVALRSGAS